MSQAAIIVASSEQSVNAGADIIRAGGNVIDAAIAAAFATSAGEPSITSLAGGGVLIHRDAGRGSDDSLQVVCSNWSRLLSSSL